MCQKTKQRFGFIHRYRTDGTKIDSNMNHKVLSVARRRTCFDKNFGIGNYNETQAAVSPQPNPTYDEEAVYDEANDPGMKTTAMIEDLMNQGGMNAAIAKKLAEKTRGQEKSEGEVRQPRKNTG